MAVVGAYWSLCTTDLPKVVRIVAEHHAKIVDPMAVEKKTKELMDVIGDEGVGSWRRRTTDVFKKHNLAD